ncbi:cytochrome P450 [Xylariaceae sp. FL1019]|nr:cytochrome P450 [Xylariaceae sp. FL1019]
MMFTFLNLLIKSGGWLFIFYCAFLWAYRLLLHPLRKYPGPLFAQVSDAYCGYFAARRCLHLQTYKNLLQYGPVLRQSPNRLIFNSVKAFKDIYQNERFIKSHLYTAAQPDLQNVFLVADRKLHRPKRKLVSGVLSDHSLRNFEPTMLQQINIFLKQILVSSNNPINLTPRCRYLGLDIAGHLGFGYDINLQTEDTYRFLSGALIAGSTRTNLCMQFPPLAWLRTGVIMRFVPNSLRARLLALINKMIATRVAQPVDANNDLLAAYMRETDTDVRQLTQSSLWTEGVFFFSAGGETVAVTLAAAFFYLSRNRDCYDQLATEIRGTFGTDGDIYSGPRLTSCRYLRACIDETLRMSPPVPCTLWREAVSHDQPLLVSGHVIPPGTQVGVNIYSLHHNEEYFPNPFQYMPERWLGSNTTKMANCDAFVPFSIGTRGCAGKTMAYLELSLALAKVLFHFDFDLAPGVMGHLGAGKAGKSKGREREGEYQLYDNFAASHDGPSLVFYARDVPRDWE